MKKSIAVFALFAASVPAMAATSATGRGHASMANQMEARVAASKRAANAPVVTQLAVEDVETKEAVQVVDDIVPEKTKDMREREKAACIQNNIGVGATFVWASRYSNTANYASMIEDFEFPENNVCFVKVAMKSDDSRIDISDVPTKYFVMGDTITCGSWANEERLKQRILDAKQKGRTWATVGGAVGGAAIGVGAMELFGNQMIGGDVEGQAGIADQTELLCSQMKVLNQEKSSKYEDIKSALREMKKHCEDATLWTDGASKPEECDRYKYNTLLDC